MSNILPFTYIYNNYQLSLIVIFSWALLKVQTIGIMIARFTTCVNRKVNKKNSPAFKKKLPRHNSVFLIIIY